MSNKTIFWITAWVTMLAAAICLAGYGL